MGYVAGVIAARAGAEGLAFLPGASGPGGGRQQAGEIVGVEVGCHASSIGCFMGAVPSAWLSSRRVAIWNRSASSRP
jgi:hypothetical protein